MLASWKSCGCQHACNKEHFSLGAIFSAPWLGGCGGEARTSNTCISEKLWLHAWQHACKKDNFLIPFSWISNDLLSIHTGPLPPGVVVVQGETVTSFIVIWSEPSSVYDNYLIVIKNPDGTERSSTNLGPQEITLDVYDLLPGTEYGIEVYSTVGTGDGLITSDPYETTGTTSKYPHMKNCVAFDPRSAARMPYNTWKLE